MTEVAIQGGRDVGRVGLGIHANRRTAIMAGHTIVHDAGMIEYSAFEAKRGTSGMTDATILVCLYMGVCFTYGEFTIMTGSTVIYDAGMIKGSRYKARGLVAHAAITVGWHMIGRWYFSSGGCAIMARCTVINNAQVIKPGAGKSRGVMTNRAILGREKMIAWLDGRYCSWISVA